MSRKRRISPTHLLIALLIGAALVAITFWKTPESRLRSALEHAASDLSYRQGEPAELQNQRADQALEAILSPSANIQIDASGAQGTTQNFSGVEGARQGLAQLRERRPTLLFELEELTLSKQGEELTGVGLLNLSETQVGDLHREQRRLDLKFIRVGEQWRIRQLRVGEADNDQPWERP